MKDGKNCNTIIKGIFAVTSKEKTAMQAFHEATEQSSLIGPVAGRSQTSNGRRTAGDEGAVE